MSSTAHDDQYTTAPEPLRQPYDTVAILKRNVADLEVALRKQTERAESYAETLRSLASYVGAGGYNSDTVDAGVFEEKIRWGIGEIMTRVAPVPAPAVPATYEIEDQLSLAETEMINAKAWSAGSQSRIHIGFAMTAISCARALLQSAKVTDNAAADRLMEGE